MENKGTVRDGKFVAFAYKVKDADNGEILFEAKAAAPDTMVYGMTPEMPPALANVMKGLSKGDRFTVTLPPEAAFGHRSEDNVLQVPVEAFMNDGKMVVEPKVGDLLPMMTDSGGIVQGKVTKVAPKYVEMDFNHPFAGKTVEYEGEIIEVRDATDDELHPRHSCGCGGCHHGEDGNGGCGSCGSGSDGGHDCGDGCGCGDCGCK